MHTHYQHNIINMAFHFGIQKQTPTFIFQISDKRKITQFVRNDNNCDVTYK